MNIHIDGCPTCAASSAVMRPEGVVIAGQQWMRCTRCTKKALVRLADGAVMMSLTWEAKP